MCFQLQFPSFHLHELSLLHSCFFNVAKGQAVHDWHQRRQWVLFPWGHQCKYFCYTSLLKKKKKCWELFAWLELAQLICYGLMEYNLIMCKLKVQVFLSLRVSEFWPTTRSPTNELKSVFKFACVTILCNLYTREQKNMCI